MTIRFDLDSCKLCEPYNAGPDVGTLPQDNERERFRYDIVSNEHPFDKIFIAGQMG